MGGLLSVAWRYWFGSKEYKIILVGLDNAGKTTILYKLSLGETVSTTATVGSNVEQVTYKNVQLEVWDLGGQSNLRPFWSTYYKGCDVLVIVVDSTDRSRMGLAKAELFTMLSHQDLARAPLLVLANKQDMPDAMTASDLTRGLDLSSIRGRDWHIQACCALTGRGLPEALDWIGSHAQAGGADGGAAQRRPAPVAAASPPPPPPPPGLPAGVRAGLGAPLAGGGRALAVATRGRG